MNLKEALDYINSLISYETVLPGKYDTTTYDLGAFCGLLKQLESPQDSLDFIHVAGTDGKGSTCAFAESILRHSGFTTGLFTSPHLSSYLERIRLNGEPVCGETFARSIQKVKDAVSVQIAQGERVPNRVAGFATVFEVLTAAAFLIFRESQVQAAVLEVGLGGRLDATNVVRPRVTVITPIHLDHTALLGPTLSHIASEKAGILKEGVLLVSAAQEPQAEQTILEAAQKLNCPVLKEGLDFEARCVAREAEGYQFELIAPGGERHRVRIAMLGDYQGQNAAVAWQACRAFLETTGRDLTPDALVRGIEETRWPSRGERIIRPEGTILIDCAHTSEAARTLRATVDAVCGESSLVWLLAFSKDKRVPEALKELLRAGELVYATSMGNPRSLATKDLVRLMPEGCPTAACESVGVALRDALAEVKKQEAWLVVAGSVYLAGAVRDLLGVSQTV